MTKAFLNSEINELEAIIAALPPESIIEIVSFEDRLKRVKCQLHAAIKHDRLVDIGQTLKES